MTPIKIGFVLLSNSRNPLPSTRISVLNMLPYLREQGFDPHVVFEPPQGDEQPDLGGLARRIIAEQFQIIYFQKVKGRSAEGLAKTLSANGIKTVYGVCDVVDPAMVALTDSTMAVTEFLRSLYPAELQKKIRVIHDGIENPQACTLDQDGARGSRQPNLRAVLVTSARMDRLPIIGRPPPWLTVSIVGNYLPRLALLQRMREIRWTLIKRHGSERAEFVRFLFNRKIRRVAWDPRGVYDNMCRANVGVLPIDTSAGQDPTMQVPGWKVKSENRLTMKMSMGLPVVATPIPSYEAIIEHGVNGFLARSTADWLKCLEQLRDPELRKEVGMRARMSVIDKFSKAEQARRLVSSLKELVPIQETAGCGEF